MEGLTTPAWSTASLVDDSKHTGILIKVIQQQQQHFHNPINNSRKHCSTDTDYFVATSEVNKSVEI